MSTTHRINEDQLEQAIVTSLNKIVKNEGFMEHEKYVRAIATNGGNFWGDLYEIDIKGKSTNGDKEINLFIKRIHTENEPSFMKAKDLQDREILVYSELATLYTQLMNEANIPESERYRQAKYYDATSDFIILENLSVKSYETLDRTTPISFSFAKSAIKQLAKFQALSFVLQNRQIEYFNTKLKHLRFPAKINNDLINMLKNNTDLGYSLLDENSVKKLKAAHEKLGADKQYEVPRRCLCHGDFRSNNMMIKQEKGQVVDLFPVDFQFIQYGNPMDDFWYLLIPHTDQEFRRKHLTTLKEIYYDTLTEFLKYFDIDVSSVYPRKEFEMDYEERAIYGLYSTIMVLTFLFGKDGANIDINDMVKSTVKLQDGAKERFQGIVEDYISWGII